MLNIILIMIVYKCIMLLIKNTNNINLIKKYGIEVLSYSFHYNIYAKIKTIFFRS